MNLPSQDLFNTNNCLKPKYWEDKFYLQDIISYFLEIKYKKVPKSFEYYVVSSTIEVYNINWN